ncbi:hypothetical protein QWZ08_19315 [Ferruginibacter paludis]|uniref:hypothetical protein n=1 Tax=Ferruginibacter paludis TaxID=1310417 RepID=UPI0025B4B46E|nr:hypothetical protein [Ferruginibacter paludis]MDN3657810.1 hypothetical protein [Ferruginibacter paludis]
MIEDLTGKTTFRDKEQYVKLHQSFLIRLLDLIFQNRMGCSNEGNLSALYDGICNHLQCTLDFMEEFFGNYFDLNEKIPEPYFTIAKEDLRKQLKRFKIAASKQSAIDSALFNHIANCINQVINKDVEFITYRQLNYFKILMNELLTLKTKLSSKTISDTLFFLNFNEPNFIMSEYSRLQQLIENEVTNNAKIEVLRFEQKIINQQSVKLHCCFSQDMPSLKEQMNGWIIEEIRYLESMPLPAAISETVQENENKIHTSLSVAKLAIIIRLLVIDKIIINRTVAPMLRVVAKTVTTLQKDEISFGSLETKYHAPDKNTVNAVKDMLFKWIHILDKL